MPEEENIEVVDSEIPEGGNGLPSEETPSEQPKEETPAEVETAEPAEPVKEPELFELPDKRMVDAETLAKEWKENFLPEFTRKSQELAKLTTKDTETINPTPENPLADPNYTPQTYAELAEQIEARTLAKLEAKEQAKIEAQQALENTVVSQLTEIKAVDPTLNENALFLHATKYGFRDLKLAHQNMKDMADVVKKTQNNTAANIAKRNDPVSVSPGATGSRPEPGGFGTAVDYLRAIKQ